MVEVFFSQDSQRMENVFHLVKSGAWSAADLEDACNAFQDWIDNDWNDAAVNDASFVGMKATDLSSETGATFEPTIAEPVPGNLDHPSVPTSVTVAISWKTALRGRSYRGRTYHVGFDFNWNDNSTISTTGLGLLHTCYTALQAHLASASLVLCVLSRRNAGALRAEGIGTPITSFSIDSNIDSQKTRLNQHGD